MLLMYRLSTYTWSLCELSEDGSCWEAIDWMEDDGGPDELIMPDEWREKLLQSEEIRLVVDHS